MCVCICVNVGVKEIGEVTKNKAIGKGRDGGREEKQRKREKVHLFLCNKTLRNKATGL